MREHHMPEAVSMGAAAARRQPAIRFHPQRVAELALGKAIRLVPRLHDVPVVHQLHPRYGMMRLERDMRLDFGVTGQVQRGAGLLSVDAEKERRPIGDEGASGLQPLDPAVVAEPAFSLHVDAVVGADEPVRPGARRERDAAIQQAVPDAILGVHPERIEQVEAVQLAQRGGDRRLHPLAVVAPEHDAALLPGIVAGEAERRVVRIEVVHQHSSADRRHHVADP